MAKYIIDVPDNTQWIQWMNVSEKDGSACFDYKAPEDLTPYVMSESYIDGLKKGQNEVWDFVQGALIAQETHPENLKECYNGKDLREVVLDSSYSEAKTKYYKWLKQKDEIRVGDELKDDGNIRAVVLDIIDEDYESYEVFTENGIVDEWQKGIVVKTGRHFDDVAELLKKMREES